jgi:hypothetical protein
MNSWSCFVRAQDPSSTPRRRALDELEQKIWRRAQRLDDLLGQARLASTELRLTLRRVAPALEATIRRHLPAGSGRGQLG